MATPTDYMGKGMTGGRIVVCPPPDAGFVPEQNIIVGNVVLYGATGGQVFIRGVAGERFLRAQQRRPGRG